MVTFSILRESQLLRSYIPNKIIKDVVLQFLEGLLYYNVSSMNYYLVTIEGNISNNQSITDSIHYVLSTTQLVKNTSDTSLTFMFVIIYI